MYLDKYTPDQDFGNAIKEMVQIKLVTLHYFKGYSYLAAESEVEYLIPHCASLTGAAGLHDPYGPFHLLSSEMMMMICYWYRTVAISKYGQAKVDRIYIGDSLLNLRIKYCSQPVELLENEQ